MKYLTITGDILWGKEVLTKEHLGMVAQRRYDTIVNLQDLTYFDANENKWLKIPSDENPHPTN